MLKRLKECLHQEKNAVIYVLLRNFRKYFSDCILDVRITNLNAPSNIHRKPDAVLLPMSAATRRSRNISKPAWTNSVTSLPLLFHVMECSEMKPREYVLQKLPRHQEFRKVLFRNYKLDRRQVRALQLYKASYASMHPRNSHHHYV